MSRRPWTPPPPRISSPPPAPPPPAKVLAGIPPPPRAAYGYQPIATTLPPLRNNTNKRPRTDSRPELPHRSSSNNSYAHHDRRFGYPTASSLTGLVTQIYNVVQALSTHLEPSAAGLLLPGRPPPSAHKFPDHPTLDDIGACLEAVYVTLHERVETLSQFPPPYGLSTSSAASKLQNATNATTAGSSSSSTTTTTLALAHETLKKDANRLSAALSRSQKRAETLGKKMVAFENENEQNALDRERLNANIEMLEETVAELRKERDDARRELLVSGSQWSNIVANATKLERGLWEEVRKRRVEEGKGGEMEIDGQCPQCSGSVARLVDVNRALKRRTDALESALERLKYRGTEMCALVQKLGMLNGQLEGEIGRVLAGNKP